MSEVPQATGLRAKGLRWAWRIGLGGLALAGPWLVEQLVLSAATRASVNTVREIAEHLPSEDRSNSPEDDLLFPLWPLDSLPPVAEESEDDLPVSEVEKSLPKKQRFRRKIPSRAPVGPEPKNSRASAQRVLDWAERQLVPQGRTRPAGDGLPAGIELYGVGALGIGLLDGDRLISVNGISVLERGEVIQAVLSARSRRAEAMTASLMRRTANGPKKFSVVVEQPYPEHVEELRKAAESSAGVETETDQNEPPADQLVEGNGRD